MRNSFFDFHLKFGVKFCENLKCEILRRNQKSMRNRHRPLNKLYCVPSSDKTKQVSEETCIEFSKFTTWSSFESYLLHASRKLKTIQYNDKDWKLSKCSCWQWCWLFLNEKSFWITQYKQRMSRSGVVAWASNSVCLKD